MTTHQEEVEQPNSLADATAVEPVSVGEQEPVFFEQEPIDVESAFAAPFPLSGEMPSVEGSLAAQVASPESAMPAQESATPTQKTGGKRRISLRMIAIIICLLVIGGITVMNVLAQSMPPLVTTQRTLTTGRATVPAPTPVASPQASSFDWVPTQLPDGWTNAGLQTSEAIQALRTGVAFTDREMSLDYRSVGTRANHGGTLVAATFLLTPQAVIRFNQNDVRVINNTLFDMMEQTKLVRLVINPQPQLVKFAQSGQQPFAWIDVSFQFWQSRLDQGQRLEGKESDAMTNQPRIHHMIVLLLHVPAQGNNPAMGGTGWLVSTYAFDPASLPDIVQPA